MSEENSGIKMQRTNTKSLLRKANIAKNKSLKTNNDAAGYIGERTNGDSPKMARII